MSRVSTEPFDWRERNDKWQKRHFLMSAVVRLGIPIQSHVYEFVDYLISQGYQGSLAGLDEVDRDVKRLYQEYKEHML